MGVRFVLVYISSFWSFIVFDKGKVCFVPVWPVKCVCISVSSVNKYVVRRKMIFFDVTSVEVDGREYHLFMKQSV